MKVFCAWCQAEGKETVMKDGPDEGGKQSHGICEAHQRKLLAEIDAGKPKKAATNPKRRKRRKRG